MPTDILCTFLSGAIEKSLKHAIVNGNQVGQFPFWVMPAYAGRALTAENREEETAVSFHPVCVEKGEVCPPSFLAHFRRIPGK